VQANKVTLDLNGKTVSYGSGGAASGQRRYGVSGIACYDADTDNNACGGYFDDLLVKNGSIVQLSGAGPYSHGIRMGQGGGKRLKVQNVNITVSSTASLPIHTTYQYGAEVSGGTITNKVTKINNRSQIEGLAARFSESGQGTSPDKVHNLKIVGGAQGGILFTTPGSSAYDNDIALAGTYTNDFGIYLWAPNAEARNNYIHGQSRGIQLRNSYNKVTANTISVYEVNKNIEYGGCQLAGTFGIQHEKGAKSALVTKNAVTVLANLCDARAVRWTETAAGNGNLSQSNYYKATRSGTTAKLAIAASFSGMSTAVSDHDTFEADSHNAEISWDGGNNILFKNPTFKKGTNPASNYATFLFNGGSSGWATSTRKDSMTVQDAIFQNGASKDSVVMRPIGWNGWALPVTFTVQWTYRLKVVNSSGSPVMGATVTITDNKGAVITRTTDSYGQIPATVLKEFIRYNTRTSVVRDTRTYTVKISKGTSCSRSVPLTITYPKSATESLSCS
jgi:hypothetical protein